jgi:hypothetical protein
MEIGGAAVSYGQRRQHRFVTREASRAWLANVAGSRRAGATRRKSVMSRKVALTTAVMVVAAATVVMTEGITSTLGADWEAAKNQRHEAST